MTPDESIARATWGLVIATGALFLVTLLLVIDGVRKSREQRKRWDEVDKRRAEEAKPNAVVEIATDTDPSSRMIFSCFKVLEPRRPRQNRRGMHCHVVLVTGAEV
jgi:hypothetical protein